MTRLQRASLSPAEKQARDQRSRKPRKLKPKRRLEKDVQREIRELLVLHGHWCEVNGVTSVDKIADSGDPPMGSLPKKIRGIRRTGFGPGSPDLLCITRRACVAVWLEVKRDEAEPLRKDQQLWHLTARAKGLHVYRVWDVKQALIIVEAINNRVLVALDMPAGKKV